MLNQFDIIIIGSGLGGLECAYILCKHGYRVLVLEKNSHAGGTLQNVVLGNCTFSTGMHYLGSLDEGQVLNKLFNYFNLTSHLPLKRMDENVFDRFFIGDKQIDFPIGWKKFEEKMNEYFPQENKSIRKYISLVKEVADSQDIYNLRYPVKNDIRLNPFLNQGIYPVIQNLTKNNNLQNALCAMNFVYGGDKNTASLYAHALINNYYVNSAWRMIGGSGQLADLLVRNIRSQGGEVLTEKEVTEFIFEGNKVSGLKLKNGKITQATQFISNVHPARTMELIPAGKMRKSYRNRIMNIPNTISVFGLHIRLKPGKVPYLNHNLYFFPENDVWPLSNYSEQKWPGFFYLYTPAKTTDDRYADSLSVYTYLKFDEVRKWEKLPIEQRGQEYENWKTQKAEKLISAVAEQFNPLKGNIVDWIASTPLTYRDYIGSPGGAMYGTLRDYHDPMSSYVFPRTKIENLFLTGQNINLHGMLGVSISALLTCGEFIGLNEILKEINEKN